MGEICRVREGLISCVIGLIRAAGYSGLVLSDFGMVGHSVYETQEGSGFQTLNPRPIE